MKRIIGIFICVVLLFSCNKNNKVQDSKIDNEPVYEQIDNNETIVANTSDDDLEYDDLEYDASENDINSPYSAFFYVWKCYEKERATDPYYGDDYTYIDKFFMTITSKSIKCNDYRENIIENYSSGYGITGTINYIEGTLPDNPTKMTMFVFLHKDDPSRMVAFNMLIRNNMISSPNSPFECHRIDRKKN